MSNVPWRLNPLLNVLGDVEGCPLAHELVNFVFRYQGRFVFDIMVG